MKREILRQEAAAGWCRSKDVTVENSACVSAHGGLQYTHRNTQPGASDMKALKIEANQSGKRYALVPLRGNFSVWAECRNYDGGVHGGIRTSWRYCERDMSREAAEALFARKVAGKAR